MRKGWAFLLLAAALALGLIGARQGVAGLTGHPQPPLVTVDKGPPLQVTVLGEVVRLARPTAWPWERP